ncbi:LOW QUALITY PROTEIN: GSK3-beta interaction protein-like [Panulirus ornatus]|uniref:LOW QUALITY PROTEIN: GSK3-beta interaction protein-like n=1 Tax=Panulirus ornatus TaxID=150431 RepID=UPI003A83C668
MPAPHESPDLRAKQKHKNSLQSGEYTWYAGDTVVGPDSSRLPYSVEHHDCRSMDDQEERVHDEEEWKKEAAAVIQDVEECVSQIHISSLPSSNTTIFFNITTKEDKAYCIELTAAGFRIVGTKYNDNSRPSESYFETPYALLDSISPLYRESFSLALANKLMKLADARNKEDVEVVN